MMHNVYCRHCDYDLHKSTGQCPECGEAFDIRDRTTFAPRRGLKISRAAGASVMAASTVIIAIGFPLSRTTDDFHLNILDIVLVFLGLRICLSGSRLAGQWALGLAMLIALACISLIFSNNFTSAYAWRVHRHEPVLLLYLFTAVWDLINVVLLIRFLHTTEDSSP